MPTVTIRDVAAEAGVSISAVSKVLNGGSQYRYKPETEEKVRLAAESLGYKAHAAARMLRQRTKTLVGIAVQARVMAEPAVSSLVVQVQQCLAEHGYQAVLVEPSQMMPQQSHAVFPSPELLAGIVSVDFSMESSIPNFYESLRSQLPIVALYPVLPDDVDVVTTDRVRAIEIAAEHLVELGHRRVAFAEIWDTENPTVQAKLEGWKRAQAKFHLQIPDEYSIRLDSHLDISVMGRNIAQALGTLATPPTAIICASDSTALYAMQHLSTMGWTVGKHISVTGFDGVWWSEGTTPSLTTVAHPVADIARSAVERLLHLIASEDAGEREAAQKLVLEPRLIVRSSTGPPVA